MSFQITITIGVPIRRAVSISCEFIMKPASPVTATAGRSGKASLAAMAPGTPIPIAAKPLEMMHELGRSG